MSMLPDVDETGYDDWQNQLFQEDAERKIQSLALDHQVGERMGDLARIGAWADAAPTTLPTPEPQPEPAPEPAVPSAAPAAAPATPPVTRGTASPPAAESPPAPAGTDDWLQSAFGAAMSAGADVGQFVSGLGTGSGDRVLDAMNAVLQAGGDVDQFLQNMRPSGRPATAPAVSPGVGGGTFQDYARQAAQKAGIDPEIFARQIQQESGFNPNARSPAGATGIAQFMPGTAAGMGIDPTDPYASLDAGARLMASHLKQYGGDYAKALAAYNAGPGNVAKYGGVPPFEETQRYVRTILGADTPRQQLTQGLERVGAAIEGANRVDPTGHTFPLIGYKVGSNGNNDPHSTYHGDGGSDLMAPRGTPIVAVGGGTVTEVMTENPNAPGSTIGGNALVVRGDDGLDYYYAHLDGAPNVARGQRIAAGDMLGAVGNTGNAWKGGKGETHLHIGIGRGISTGQGAAGGLGQNFDAKGFLSGLLPMSGDAPRDQPRVSPHAPDQTANPIAWLNNAKDSLVESLTPKPKPSTELEGAAVLPERSSTFSNISQEFGAQPTQQAAGVGGAQPIEIAGAQTEPAKNPLEEMGSNIANAITSGLRNLGLGGDSTQPVNAPGQGYDPSSLRAITEPSQPGIPLRQDARDLAPQPITRAEDVVEQQAISPVPAPGRGYDPSALRPVTEAPDEGVPLRQDVRDLGQPAQPTIFEDPTLIPRVLRGPALVSDQELLQQAGPEGIENARQLVRLTTRGREPTDAEVADMLRSMEVGQAYAGTHTGGGTGPEGVRAIPERPLPEGAKPIELTPAQEVERLRLEMFPEEVRPVIQEAAENVDFARQQRRGVIPDEVANRLAQEWADDHTLDQVIRQGAAGKAYNTEELRALRNATGAQGARVADAAAAIHAGDDSSAALQTFWNEQEKLQRLVTIAEGGKAEWGRAGRALNEPVRLINLPPNEAVAQITKLLGGDRDRLVQAIGEYQKLVDSGAGPIQQAEFWTNLKTPPMNLTNPGDWLEWLKSIRYNSMLSGPRTAEINSISFLTELPWRLTRDIGASVMRGRPEEIGPEAAGILSGLGKGNRAFMEALTKGMTTEQALRGGAPQGLAPRVRNPIGKAAAQAIDAPGRVLNAADQWATAIARDMAMGRRAGQIASREGLRGKEWDARVAEVLANPPRGVEKEAAEIADRMVFHGDMGQLGEALMKVADVPVIGNILLPFVRTTYQLTSRGIERSPLGAVGTAIDVARGAYGPRTKEGLAAALRGEGPRPKGVTPLGERLGDNLMGSAVFAYFYQQAMSADPKITGAGPQNAADRDLLRSEGWQPYSIKIGDDWVSYANWGPIAWPLSEAAAAAEAQRFAKPGAQTGELFVDGARRTAQILTEQTYLQGIAAIYRGLTDPERYGAQAVHNTVTSLLPYGGALNTVAQAGDPYARKVEGFDPLKAIQARLPAETPFIGGREEVPIAQDVLGRPLPNTRYGAGAINPLLVSEERHDPVLEELDRLGMTVPPPPRSVTRGGTEYQLTPDEQRALQAEGGNLIADRLGAEFAEDSYKRLTEQAKAKRIELIISYARTQTNNAWLQRLSEEDYQRRRAEAEGRKEIVPVSGR